jgi:dTDP-4-dehydrorhamnose reductase
MKIVVLGDGLLGSEIVKQTGWDFISRKKDGFDITQDEKFNDYFIENHHGVVFTTKYDVVLNCIACTDTYSDNRDIHWDVNYRSVVNLSNFCTNNKIKLVHISTDYVYTNSESMASEDAVPVHGANWYSYTKLLGDSYVQLDSNHLVLRGTHKETPFKYKEAWVNQIGNFDYVDVISKLIISLINKKAIGLYNVGTELKTMKDLAFKTNLSILPKLINNSTPLNVSMNVNKLNKLNKL